MSVPTNHHENVNKYVTMRPGLSDYLSLMYTVLARLRRRKLRKGDEVDETEFYEEFMAAKDVAGWGKDERENLRRRTIVDYVTNNVVPGSQILDVGCGYGETLLGIPDCFNCRGFDYAHSNIRMARQLLGDRVELKQGTIYEIPFDTESQDVCICLEVIEHIEDDVRAVHEIARVLKRQGKLIASVPYTYYWPQYKTLIGHHRHYTRASFCDLLALGGLKICRYLPNYPNWNAAYDRLYCRVKMLSIAFGPFLRRRNVFEFKWPWRKRTEMLCVSDRLGPLLVKDGALDYCVADTSTFVVAEKV